MNASILSNPHQPQAPGNAGYSTTARLIHLGLALFGVAAFLTGELAEEGARSGYLIHAYLGLSLAATIVMRLSTGLGSSGALSFRHWHLLGREGRAALAEDLRGLVKFSLPAGRSHAGLAGWVQAYGLFVFTFMALTGTGLYFLADSSAHTLYEAIEELHEGGEGLIPVYLLLHVGSVILHTLAGHSVWQRMFRLTGTNRD